ncbi:MAG TPA: ATP synthase F1 subunit gamma [Polyangiaceae bacterium]|nr:ATP synthase F1 subunit gamma [Polyangiaceae bacterium]
MANLKQIRKRIASVKSTQKITRAMKMVAGARLTRAQQRIVALRPFAVQTAKVLANVTAAGEAEAEESGHESEHPLLVRRPVQTVLMLVVTSDRGQCGAFNTNILRAAERERREREERGQKVLLAVIGRKGRDFYQRRKIPLFHIFSGIWEKLETETARVVARKLLKPFLAGEVDSIQLVYNEFKSAMTQKVVVEPLFPLAPAKPVEVKGEEPAPLVNKDEFLFEPSKEALLERLVPMYVEISLLRALYESMASELGARMTAMDSATKNAAEVIANLTLVYNRARQAAITTELMEIIGGAEALKD